MSFIVVTLWDPSDQLRPRSCHRQTHGWSPGRTPIHPSIRESLLNKYTEPNRPRNKLHCNWLAVVSSQTTDECRKRAELRSSKWGWCLGGWPCRYRYQYLCEKGNENKNWLTWLASLQLCSVICQTPRELQIKDLFSLIHLPSLSVYRNIIYMSNMDVAISSVVVVVVN